MPIDPDLAIGAELPSRSFAWTESDVLLYHLGGGLRVPARRPARPGRPWPSPPSRAPPGRSRCCPPSASWRRPSTRRRPPRWTCPGWTSRSPRSSTAARPSRSHGPLPTNGRATLTTRISDVWDKGKAAVIVQESTAVDEVGQQLFTTRSSIFVRGEGGFGGERGPSSAVEVPERDPDLGTTYAVTPQQALLYRLCGDRNPLHADPGFADARRLPGADPPRPVLLRHRAARGPPGPARLRRLPRGRVLRPVRRRGAPRRDDPHDGLAGRTTGSWSGPPSRPRDTERDGAPVLADAVVDLRS